ncbi:MAG: divalent-cation tolerance protein CutA [Deltaproteobacteria bacterium]|nr:divalent-cation tolerance protein CutA [Deltaproteobacteria bacterium]MBW2395323.1 divalent-cation tolerance protein CutA [Deltaproteobacteria bacterium]
MTLEGERDDVQLVLVTAPNGEVAAQLGRTLVEERLAACVNVVPGLRSIYRWEGEIQDDAEVLLMVKTRADRLDSLTRRVQELHPYDVPEILALPIAGGSQAYLAWVRSEASA